MAVTHPPVYRGTVTKANAAGVWARIPRLVPKVQFGPMQLVANVVRVGPLTTSTVSSHSHTVPQTEWLCDLIEPGDQVLVADLGRPSHPDLVVVGVIRQGVSA